MSPRLWPTLRQIGGSMTMNKVDSLMERLELVKLARLNEPPEDGLSASLREFYEGMEPEELERLGAMLESDSIG